MYTLQAGAQHGVAHVVAPPLTATNDPSRSPQSSEVTAQVHAVLQAQTIAHVDVVGTLSDGAHNGGGLNGQDAYTGRILPVVPYDLFQVTAPINRQNRDTTSPCHTLARDNAAHAAVVQSMAVRRLTPRECERLQGFPDDYTKISWKKKPSSECPDGPRYKALGNSMAVPCMNWIGRKIDKEYRKRHAADT
jgi:site-specific DNA-cytosine methylase